MKFVLGSSKRVPFYAHPILWILTSAVGVATAVLAVKVTNEFASLSQDVPLDTQAGHWVEFLFPVRAPWMSVLLGVAVGLLTMLIEKRLLRSHIQFYADFFAMPIAERLRWRVQRTNLLICLPMVVGPLLAAGLALVLRIAPIPAIFGPYICALVVYPEQKLIYEMAASRIAQKDSSKEPAPAL